MTRDEARATLATWDELLADPADHPKYGRAVQALYHACRHYAAECERLEAVVRLDVGHLAELGKANRDLREMVPQWRLDEHVGAEPARAIERAC